jgi:hypothetical protein
VVLPTTSLLISPVARIVALTTSRRRSVVVPPYRGIAPALMILDLKRMAFPTPLGPALVF